MLNLELQPLQVALLPSISPSSFCALGSCLLRSACRAARNPDLLASPQNNRIGTVAHSLLEEAGRGRIGDGEEPTLLEERWEALVVREEEQMKQIPLQRRFIPLSKHVGNYEITRYRAINQARALARNHVLPPDQQERTESSTSNQDATPLDGAIFYERLLSTPDKAVRGKLDFWQETPEGAILRDYKTGSIWAKAEPEQTTRVLKKDYEVQLKLYAALYHANTGRWPLRLEVAPLDEPEVQIPFSPQESGDLLLTATTMLRDCNDRIQASIDRKNFEELATPAPQICGHCTFRPGCSAYWQARSDPAVTGWPHDVAGRLIQKQKLGNGKWLLKIVTSSGDEVVITLSANQELYPGLERAQIGENCAIYSLKPRLGSSDSLVETPFTLLKSSANPP
jgi:hypothetical protein